MKEQTKSDQKSVRPTKKQFETLAFIKEFIDDNGFSPSYREIMRGCDYTSVATVALHVKNLIARGHIVKRDKSARSLEVVSDAAKTKGAAQKTVDHTQKLITEIEQRFTRIEKKFEQSVLDEVYVLVGALKILGHPEPAREYAEKIATYRNAS